MAMLYPLNALRKVRLPSGLVKGFCAILLVLAGTLNAENHKVKPIDYGPFIIEQALIWVPEYLDAERVGRFGFDEPTDPAAIRLFKKLHAFEKTAREVMRNAYSFRYLVNDRQLQVNRKGLVEFRKGGDPIFNLKKDEEPRTAVTGDAVDSKVIFNLGKISNPEQFTFGDAVRLWVHEIGHKVKLKLPDLTQKEIDELADSMGQRYGYRATIIEMNGKKLWTFGPSPVANESGSFESYMMTWQIPLGFAVIDQDRFYDLTVELNRELDKWEGTYAWGSRNYFERIRKMINLQPLQGNKMLLELRTHRVPINMNHYSYTDMGGAYYKSGVVELGDDLSLRVEAYNRQDPPRELIEDARAEISNVRVEDGKVVGYIKFIEQNEKHHHAVGYPSSTFKILAMLDGRPKTITADINFKMKPGMGRMDLYKEESTKEGAFNFPVEGLDAATLEITGVVSRFFTFGRDYAGPDNELKRLRIGASVTVKLGCDGHLKKPHEEK